MAEPAFYRCGKCLHTWQRMEWKTRRNPPAACPRCGSTEQTIDQAREDEYVRQVYGPITLHVGQILTKKLEGKE